MTDGSKSNSETVVQIDGVTRRFGSTAALFDVSLSVPRGTVFGLVGVNGAGKTTLLKHVLGLLKAQTGRVRVFALEWTAVCNGRLDALRAAVAEAGARIVEQRVPSLDEIFVAQVGKKCPVSEGE